MSANKFNKLRIFISKQFYHNFLTLSRTCYFSLFIRLRLSDTLYPYTDRKSYRNQRMDKRIFAQQIVLSDRPLRYGPSTLPLRLPASKLQQWRYKIVLIGKKNFLMMLVKKFNKLRIFPSKQFYQTSL